MPIPLFRVRLDEDLVDLATAPLRIALIVLLAVVLRVVVHRAVGRLVRRMTIGALPDALRERAPVRLLEGSPEAVERRRQRAETLGSVLRSVVSFVLLGVATLMVLSELGLDLRPVLASAGIVGVAIGFGAQHLVKDFLAGMFLLLEDQYGVGDVVTLGTAEGVVESVGLRSTRLRAVDGTVWHIRNGEVASVGNRSQGWGRVVLDVPVPAGTDLDRAAEVLREVTAGLRDDDAWAPLVLGEPELWGVGSWGTDSTVLRLAVRTAPHEQERVAGELRRRLVTALAGGVTEPPPKRRTTRTRA